MVSTSVPTAKAADMLAQMLYQVNPRDELDISGEPERNGYTIFRNSLTFYRQVFGVRPLDPLARQSIISHRAVHTETPVPRTVTDGIFRTERILCRMAGGSGEIEIVTFARAQITGTCTFHSVMWLLYHHQTFHKIGGDHAMDEIEQKMRKFVYERIGPPTTAEERVCYRLMTDDFGRQLGTTLGRLYADVAPRLDEVPAANFLPTLCTVSEKGGLGPYAYRGEEFIKTAEEHISFCCEETHADLVLEGFDALMKDIGAILQHVPVEERAGPCGTHYSSTLLNLAQSVVLNTLECIWTGRAALIRAVTGARDDDRTVNIIVKLAEAVAMVFPLFEGKDRHKMAHVNFWTQAYHRRYRRSVWRTCWLVIRLQDGLSDDMREAAREDNTVEHAPISYFNDDSISGEEAALLRKFVHFGWSVCKLRSPFWTEFAERKSPPALPFQQSLKFTIETGPDAVLVKDLKKVADRPVGYALVLLMTFLSAARMEADAAYFRDSLPLF